MSYFAHRSAAERYAAARPFFHPVVLNHMREHLGPVFPLERALDVGCGTGQSTRILSELGRDVVGSDVSAEMLAEAAAVPNVRYVRSSAESLPFRSDAFDLLTVALAFHWFDRETFLREARRVLCLHQWLVIYDNSFMAEMEESPTFRTWFVERYITRYPSPPRNRTPLTEDTVRSHGFELTGHERYRNSITFDRGQLIDYLMTQSNVIAAVEQGNESPQSVRSWLDGELGQFLNDDPGTFLFGGPITYLRLIA